MQSTSLAQQLKRLEVPTTSGAGADSLRGASFLFDRKTQVDRETIFAIGINGLEELEILQPEFSRFRETLFDDSSIRLERSVESRKTNDKLDVEVTAFLRLLSPFLLLKPAHKALEWLVHRFSIHLYNGDRLMDCALPYHDTLVFVRVVQLMNLEKLPRRWRFLEQCQKTGSPLSKLAIFNRCHQDLDFLRHIGQLVKDAVQVEALREKGRLRTLVLFYLSTTLAVLEREKTVSEALLTTLLPFLVAGLQSAALDYVSASYVLLAQLALKVNAIGRVWNPLLKVIICQKTPKSLMKEAISCAAIICQTQALMRLPPRCCKRLIALRMQTVFAELSERSDVSRLTRLAVRYHMLIALKAVGKKRSAKRRNLPAASKTPLRTFTWLTQNVRLTNEDVSYSVKILMKTYVKLSKKRSGDHLKVAIRILELLEKRFVGDFDDLLGGHESWSNEKSKEAVALLVHAFQTNPKVASKSANRFLALNHPSAARRKLAVLQLAEEDKLDAETYAAYVMERLADDDPEVVAAVLGSRRLMSLLPVERVADSLVNLVDKCRTMPNWTMNHDSCALELATINYDEAELSTETQSRIVVCLLPILFDKRLELISGQLLQKGTVPLLEATLNGLRKHVSESEEEKPTIIVKLEAVAGALVKAHSTLLKKRLMELLLSEATKSRDQKKYDGIDRFFARSVLPLLLGEWLMAETNDALRIELTQGVLQFIADGSKKRAFRRFIAHLSAAEAEAALNWEEFYGKESFMQLDQEASVLLFALSRLMAISKLPTETREMKWFDVTTTTTIPFGQLSPLLRANATIFQILTDFGGSEISPILMKEWSHMIFAAEETDGIMKLLLFLATSPDCNSITTQLRSLHVVRSLVAAAGTTFDRSIVVAAILAACTSTIDVIRSTAVGTLSTLARRFSHDPFAGLLSALAARREEIQEDVSDALLLPSIDSLLPVVIRAHFESGDPETLNELNALLQQTVNRATPDHIQDKLLFCLSDVDDPHCLLELIPLLDTILECRDSGWLTAARHSVAQKIIRHFTARSAPVAFRKSPNAFSVFIKALRHCDVAFVTTAPDEPSVSLQMTVLSNISKTMFEAIGNDDLQQEIVRHLVDLQVDNEDYEATSKMVNVLRKTMSKNGLLVRRELERSVQKVPTARLLKDVKLSKQTTAKSADEAGDFSHRRMVILLEALSGKLATATGQDHRVVSVLFAHLKRYLDRRRDHAASEYGKQLILSALNNALQCGDDVDDDDDHGTSGLGQDQFNVELVIDCIRTSSSPKTHQEALLLLALAAKRFPEHVIHNTMAIFTFMGENVVRKDDSSSFDVILKTVEAIVPAVVVQNDGNDENDVAMRTACALTRVFVDAVPDIPEHRRLPLFTCLVSGMGESRYLWLTVALVLERLVTYKRIAASSEKSSNFSRLGVLEFAVQLSHRYLPSCQIASCESLVDCLIQLPDVEEREVRHRDVSKSKRSADDILDLQRHSARLRCQFKLMVAEFVSTLLSSRPFLNQVVDLRPDEQEQMMLQYQSLLKKVLTAAHAVAGRLATLKSDDSALIKYFKVLQHRVYELLDKLSSLLPSNLFVDVIDQLMRDGQLLVRHKALEILAAKLQHRGDNLDKPNRTSLKRVVPTLLHIVQSTDDEEEDKDSGDRMILEPKTGTEASNRQLALLTLKYLCRQLGAEEPHLFRSVLEAATDVVRDPNVDDNVRAAALLYVAEHCHSVRSDAIAHLSAFAPALLSVLDRHRMDAIQKHELLLLSVISALHKVVERLAPFLSPYIADILQKVCHLSILEPGNPNSPLVDRLTTIRSNLAISVPARVLVPAVKSCFETFAKSGEGKAIGPLMATLREYVIHANKDQLHLWHSTLFSFYLMALDYRSEQNKEDEESVSEVEGCIIEPMLATILKMSEATFRPFFIKLFDWAVRGDGPADRVITFYRIADRIADQLKSLFVLFAGHLIKNAAVMLDRNNLSKTDDPFFVGEDEARKGLVLVRYILSCLHKCFLYDNEGFMTKERFETLLQPVVDQLENVHDGGDENDDDDYERLIVDCVAPCVARMAVATSSDAFWKPLNYQVLLKTRHQLPKVRFGALQVLREVTKTIGEDYVNLLPETIPFLAELMEDEKLEVEQQCQAVIADMEVVLGEPLQKYF